MRCHDKDNSTDSHQRQDCPGVFSSQSRILDIQRTKREALIHQSETLCAAERASTDAVLERLSVQQDPLPSPQPPAGPRQKPERRRIRPAACVPPSNVEVDGNSRTSRTQRHQRSPATRDEEVEEVYLRRDWSSSPSASISLADTHTRSELTTIPLITTPHQTPITTSPPPQPRRRLFRLPVISTNLSGPVKEFAGGYRLQTAKYQMEHLQKRLEDIQQNPVRLPQPPATQRRMPAMTRVAPAPPQKPAPPRKSGPRHRTNFKLARAVNGGMKTANKCNLQTAKEKELEKLQPLRNPVESLSLSFEFLSSDNWTRKIEGLQNIQALVQHHPDTLMVKLHEVCLAVIEQVKSLRSSVSSTAMDTFAYLYVYLKKEMDPQVDRTSRALLLKIAQANANVFVRQQANMALGAMVQNCSPGRVLNALLNTGLSHLSAAVRASTAQQLHLLADTLGADAVLTAGKNFTHRFLTAVSKMSLDSAAEVRPHGHAILHELSLHRDFQELWRDIITEKDQCPLKRILRTAKQT